MKKDKTRKRTLGAMWTLGTLFFWSVSLPVFASESAPNFSVEGCQNIKDVSSLYDQYQEQWVEAEKLEQSSNVQMRFEETRDCILDYSYAHRGNYLLSLKELGERVRASEKQDVSLQAYLSLLLDMNQRWESEMYVRKLIREEDEVSQSLVWATGISSAILASHLLTRTIDTKNLTKMTRFVRTLWGKPQVLNGVLRRVGLASMGPGARVTYYSGGGLGLGAHEVSSRNDRIQSELDMHKSSMQSITGDFAKQVWSSPIFVVDLLADHRVNELTSYAEFQFYREMGSILAGTVFGLGAEKYLAGVAAKHLTHRKRWAQNFYKSIRKISSPKLARKILGSGKFAVAMGTGIGLYILGTSATREAVNQVTESKIEDRYQKQKVLLKQILETRLESLQDSESRLSSMLFGSLYSFRYSVEARARYYRGLAELKREEAIYQYSSNYACAGLQYQKFHYDNLDREQGVDFPADHYFMEAQRAEQLYHEGEQKLQEIDSQFYQDLNQLQGELNSDPNLQMSLATYDEAIEILESLAKETKKYFIHGMIQDLRAEKQRSIYNFQAQSVYTTYSLGVISSYHKEMNSSETREQGSCPEQSFRFFYEEKRQKAIELFQ